VTKYLILENINENFAKFILSQGNSEFNSIKHRRKQARATPQCCLCCCMSSSLYYLFFFITLLYSKHFQKKTFDHGYKWCSKNICGSWIARNRSCIARSRRCRGKEADVITLLYKLCRKRATRDFFLTTTTKKKKRVVVLLFHFILKKLTHFNNMSFYYNRFSYDIVPS
jgi:hypothetical protein